MISEACDTEHCWKFSFAITVIKYIKYCILKQKTALLNVL